MRGGGRKMRHRTEICKPRERDAGLLVATTSFIRLQYTRRSSVGCLNCGSLKCHASSCFCFAHWRHPSPRKKAAAAAAAAAVVAGQGAAAGQGAGQGGGADQGGVANLAEVSRGTGSTSLDERMLVFSRGLLCRFGFIFRTSMDQREATGSIS